MAVRRTAARMTSSQSYVPLDTPDLPHGLYEIDGEIIDVGDPTEGGQDAGRGESGTTATSHPAASALRPVATSTTSPDRSVVIPGRDPEALPEGANGEFTVTITGGPTGGTFAIGIDHALGEGSVTGIPRNVAHGTLKALIAGELGVPAASLTSSGGALPGTPIVIGIPKGLGLLPIDVEITADGLTGGTDPTPSISAQTPGFEAFDNDLPVGAEIVLGGGAPGNFVAAYKKLIAGNPGEWLSLGTLND